MEMEIIHMEQEFRTTQFFNVPDVIEIHGVFESADTNNATAPKLPV